MYEIRNDGEIYIYDEILTGQTARQVLTKLREYEGAATIRINSMGGDVFEALALYNALKGHEVNVYIDGVCASAASIIAMAGTVHMPENAMMMIHNPTGSAWGDSQELSDMAALLDRIRDSIAGIYASKTGHEVSEIISLMDKETWMSGKEAHELGFADILTGPVTNHSHKTYEDGIRDERERLSALDALSGTGREAIISRAKYETYQTAQDIAIELLRAEQRISDSVTVPASVPQTENVIDMAGIINKARGYK